MDHAILIVGKNVVGTENYQLFIGNDYHTVEYDGSIKREEFNEQVADMFVNFIITSKISVKLGIVNGNRINPNTGKYESIEKLEDKLAKDFSDLICTKIERMPVFTLPLV